MTLFRQIFILIIVLFIALFTSTLLVNFNSARDYLTQQLQSHAQDTATSLGLSLSQFTENMDLAAMETAVGAIFDRGYYKEISVQTSDQQLLVERRLEVKIENVPEWFIRWVALETPRVGANVMAGWNPAGAVYVTSHPGYAYKELWRTTNRMLLWFTVLAALTISLAAVGLRNILKPLRAVEQQADSLYQGQYTQQSQIPGSRELKRVVLAMNRMTEKVKWTFEEQERTAGKLREQVFSDPVTDLANRRQFDNTLQLHLTSSTLPQHGALLLIHLHSLTDINNQDGYEKGDEFLRATATRLRESISETETALVARLTGADFALLLPAADIEEMEELATRICADLARLHTENFSPATNILNIGITLYRHGQEASDILARADAALRVAQADGPNSWSRGDDKELTEFSLEHQEWRVYLSKVIEKNDIVLNAQPVVDVAAPNRILHAEVLARIPRAHNQVWRAGEFMPIAEKFGLAQDLNRIILSEGLMQLAEFVEAPAWTINMSSDSLADDAFVEWILDSLGSVPGSQSKVILEFSELGAFNQIERMQEFAAQLRSLGHGFALDHFGRGFSYFGYLQSLRPDYVKIDGAYTGFVIDDRDNQFFVASLCNIVHSMDIKAIAAAVENQHVWDVLKELPIDGIQGYAVSRPVPIEDWGKSLSHLS